MTRWALGFITSLLVGCVSAPQPSVPDGKHRVPVNKTTTPIKIEQER